MTAAERLLRTDEITLVAACLLAAEEGPFFPDWEFHSLFGIERSDVTEIRRRWPNVDLGEEKVYLAVMNAIANLYGYPHGEEDVLRTYIPGGRKATLQLSNKLAMLALRKA